VPQDDDDAEAMGDVDLFALTTTPAVAADAPAAPAAPAASPAPAAEDGARAAVSSSDGGACDGGAGAKGSAGASAAAAGAGAGAKRRGVPAGLSVNAKWLQHLEERLLGEDGHPRKAREGEDPHRCAPPARWRVGACVPRRACGAVCPRAAC
jgi:hypothetical protein